MTSSSSSLDPDAPQSASDFIEMRGISKRFGGVRALQDVSFSIHSAEIHSLAGENGCGKSTLSRCFPAFTCPMKGKSFWRARHTRLSPAASQRFGVQIIYQDLSLFPNLTVAENIAFRHHVETPVRMANPNVMRKQAQAVMDRLKVSLPLDELVGTLPIATRQLVAICRALAAEARLVVMDEPTAS
jgi:simple sugar transport system ATP-binding protein